MNESDKQLWNGWLYRRDEHAFEALVTPHVPFALDFARRLGCRPDEADDVVQTCLARLAAETGPRPVEVGLRAWIGRSVSLEARMFRRSEGRRARREQAWAPPPSEVQATPEQAGEVEQAIAALTDAQREVVLLRFRYDLEYADIATILKISENACRLRVHKAMRDLRRRLGDDAGPMVAALPLLGGAGGANLALAATAGSATAWVLGIKSAAAVIAMVFAGVMAVLLVFDDGDTDAPPGTAVEEAAAPPPDARPGPAADPEPPPVPAPGEPPPGEGGRVEAPPGAEPVEIDDERAPAAPEADAAPAGSPRAKGRPIDVRTRPRDYRKLIEAGRGYFDLDEERWRGRKRFLDALHRHALQGEYFLKDPAALRWLVQQTRSFLPLLSDRKWQRANDITEFRPMGGTVRWLRSAALNLTLSVPRDYPKEKHLSKDVPRPEPFPLVLAMHEKGDYTGQEFPAGGIFERRYPKRTWKSLYKEWLLLCPHAAAGNYLEADGRLRPEVFQDVYAAFWKRYHVDFERVILDGARPAFTAASALPGFFAGIVLRQAEGHPWSLDRQMDADVRNFAPVPVYVVDSPDLAEQLKRAGHPDVTAGDGGAALHGWMKARRRKTPREFRWTARRVDQVLPYWVNLDSPDWDATERSVGVHVVDTKKDPNTIRMEVVGVRTLSLFLNDEIVDLDRPVRVRINGKTVHDGPVAQDARLLEKVGRDFDLLFDTEPVRIRMSMYFGWLHTARLVNLTVPNR